jgi:hypothetical protein
VTDSPAERAEAPTRAANAAAAYLIDLVTNTADPGYAAETRRRAQQARDGDVVRHRWDAPAALLGCLLIGFMLAAAYTLTGLLPARPRCTRIWWRG